MDDERLIRAREIIAEADREMARCFVRRMEAVRAVALYKQEKGLPVLDAAQEEVVTARGLACVEPEELREPYRQFIRGVKEISRGYQRRLMEGGPDERSGEAGQ